MSRTINVLVLEHKTRSIEVTKFGQEEPDRIAGTTFVVFETGDGQTFEIDWTWRADAPRVGSKWTLTEVAP